MNGGRLASRGGLDSTLRVGPVRYRLRTPLPSVARDIRAAYQGYPFDDPDDCAEFEVNLRPTRWWRRFIRPQITVRTDIHTPMVPLPGSMGLLAAEMGMNLQVALGMRRCLLLHASTVERDGLAYIFPAGSGSGKSTLSAALGFSGDWRFMGDEFALIDLDTGLALPFPRPISLKNQSIAVMRALARDGVFSAAFETSHKGTISFLTPPADAIRRMNEPARPAAIIFPTFEAGAAPHGEAMTRADVFVHLASSSANFDFLGEAGFETMWRLAETCPGFMLRYGSTAAAIELVDAVRRTVTP
ncbi:HprK-related kinase A [Parapedomonas caeni]